MLIVNAGSDQWNYQVSELAEAVAKVIPGTKIETNLNAAPDKRSYRVNFSKFSELAPNHQPKISLDDAVRELRYGLVQMGFANNMFRDSEYIRLNVLNDHIESNRITRELNWT
jgi:hypothetical protein